MKRVADTLSPFAPHRQLRQDQAELCAQHQHDTRERAPLRPAAPSAWQQDYFLAVNAHARDALYKARLGDSAV